MNSLELGIYNDIRLYVRAISLLSLIFLILIVITAIIIFSLTNTISGGAEIRRDQTIITKYPLDKYAYLFDHLTKAKYETALLYSELKYILRRIRTGETSF